MKIIVIGLGSMGKRRIRLLQKFFPGHTQAGVDLDEARCQSVGEEYRIPVYTNMEEALEREKPQCAFVCTAPLSHGSIIGQCLKYKLHVFTEINLVADSYEENMALAEKMQVKLFLSSSMIYRDELQYLREKIYENQRKVCYTYHVGQYLPDWHPWEDYRSFFVGQKKTNGCREILAIELPWMVTVFGGIKCVSVQKTKLTDLAIDYDDCYMILLEHQNGTMGTFTVDVVSREPVRMLRVFDEKLYLEWNGEPESLRQKNVDTGEMEQIALYQAIEHLDGYNKTIVENEYQNEMEQFFAELETGRAAVYGFQEDQKTLEWIDRIENQ